jgi:hypothetical protein
LGFAALTAAAEEPVFYSVSGGDEISGAWIDASGLIPGETYTLNFNVTLTDDNWSDGLRVRWSKIVGWGEWNDDAGNFSYSANEGIPAIIEGLGQGTHDITVTFEYAKADPGVDPEQCNYIAIVGLSGDHGFVVNSVELIDAGGGGLTPDASGLVWDAVSSGEFELVVSAADAYNVGHIQQANGNGAAVFTYTKGTGLKVTGRAADWNSIDFNTENLPDGKYRLSVQFAADSEVEFAIDEGGGSYAWLVSETGTNVTLDYTLDVKNGSVAGMKKFRLRTRQTEDYTIANIELYLADFSPSETAAPPAAATDEPDAQTEGGETTAATDAGETAAAATTTVSSNDEETSDFPVLPVAIAGAVVVIGIIVFAVVRKKG